MFSHLGYFWSRRTLSSVTCTAAGSVSGNCCQSDLIPRARRSTGAGWSCRCLVSVLARSAPLLCSGAILLLWLATVCCWCSYLPADTALATRPTTHIYQLTLRSQQGLLLIFSSLHCARNKSYYSYLPAYTALATRPTTHIYQLTLRSQQGLLLIFTSLHCACNKAYCSYLPAYTALATRPTTHIYQLTLRSQQGLLLILPAYTALATSWSRGSLWLWHFDLSRISFPYMGKCRIFFIGLLVLVLPSTTPPLPPATPHTHTHTHLQNRTTDFRCKIFILPGLEISQDLEDALSFLNVFNFWLAAKPVHVMCSIFDWLLSLYM